MATNKTKTDRLHDLLPDLFNSRNNINWSALVKALGEADQSTADLIEEVRKQLFVKSADRPYLDRLGSNVNISRPRLVGLQDEDFRKYIPILAYQPKQVKQLLNKLLDIFYLRDATSSYSQSALYSPYVIEDSWGLEYIIDGLYNERVAFDSDDFTNIAIATAQEVVAAINRQVKYSFAAIHNDSLTGRQYVRLFTNTFGSKGTVKITGGLANIGFQFTGFNTDAGNGADTQWTVTKVGDLMRFQHTAGTAPGIEALEADDIAILDITSNEGSFIIETVDVSTDSFYFRNVLGTVGVFIQTSANQSKFLKPEVAAVYKNDRRAIVWETSPDTITTEVPATPGIVKRKTNTAWHLNGLVANMTNRVSTTSLTIDDATDWPAAGTIQLQPLTEIKTKIPPSTTLSETYKGRLIDGEHVYTYAARTGSTLTGITPNLPSLASIDEFTITTASRSVSHVVTVTTTTTHDIEVGDVMAVENTTGLTTNPNGAFTILSVTSNTLTYFSYGDSGVATGGTVRIERSGLANAGSLVYLRTAVVNITPRGSYVWDTRATFVLSSLNGDLTNPITAGTTAIVIDIGTNSIPNEDGHFILDYGTNEQEGPIRYFYKPTSTSVAIDPAYVFLHDHSAGAKLSAIRRRGPHPMSGSGAEYPLYLTDPIVAREVLEDIIRSVQSVGLFLDFLVRYPQTYYGSLDIYRSGIDPDSVQ